MANKQDLKIRSHAAPRKKKDARPAAVPPPIQQSPAPPAYTYRESPREAPEADAPILKEVPPKKRRRSGRSLIWMVFSRLVLVGVLLTGGYLLWQNWEKIAPDSLVIWVEEKLTLLTELLEKAVGWILKASLGVVTGISVFQSLITPVLDSVKTSAVEKALSALPGIGNAADGLLELAVGSAVVIRNSIGVLLLLLLLAACAAPLLEILFTAFLIKCAAAFMGIVSDKRVTNCTDHMGNAGMLLFRTAGTAMLLFLITLALLAIGSRGR